MTRLKMVRADSVDGTTESEGLVGHTDSVEFEEIGIAFEVARQVTDDQVAAAILAVGAVLADRLDRLLSTGVSQETVNHDVGSDDLMEPAGGLMEREWKNLPKSRVEAKRLGMLHFFTGKPCRHFGHVAPRFTSNGACVSCGRAIVASQHARARAEKKDSRAHQPRLCLGTACAMRHRLVLPTTGGRATEEEDLGF